MGFCGLTDRARCYRELINPYEERELSPSHHVYFAGCNLRCEFCTVSEWNERPGAAAELDVEAMSAAVARARAAGARNLNLVGGEPAVSLAGVLDLLAAVPAATRVVWNSNMYFSPLVLEVLDGLADVVLADFKAWDTGCGKRLLGAADYAVWVRLNLRRERRLGDLIVRHLVLPGHFECCTRPILEFLARDLPGVKVSLRGDYVPPARAKRAPAGYLTKREHDRALDAARSYGLNVIE